MNHHNSSNEPKSAKFADNKTTISLEHVEKFIISGSCAFKGEERSFLCRLNLKVRFEETEIVYANQSHNFRSGTSGNSKKIQELKYATSVEAFRILGGNLSDGPDCITALEYGPYDNGYILAGMLSGKLLVFDPITLKRVNDFDIFTKGRMRG